MEYLYVSNVFVRALRLIIAYKFHPSACQICIDTEWVILNDGIIQYAIQRFQSAESFSGKRFRIIGW